MLGEKHSFTALGKKLLDNTSKLRAGNRIGKFFIPYQMPRIPSAYHWEN